MKFRTNMLSLRVYGLALVSLVVVFQNAQSRADNKQATLIGTISDSMCGAKHMMTGDDAKCARTCVKSGAHYAPVVGDKVYPLKAKPEELDRLAGQTVSVTGDLTDSGLIVMSVAAVQSFQSSADADNTPPPRTIEGLVRDIACPIQNKQATATEFNLKCAQDCARLGSPLIVLTRDGTLYTPISESMPDQDQRQRLMPFLGKYVRVTGPVFERNGTRAIAIRTIEEVKGVALKTDAE